MVKTMSPDFEVKRNMISLEQFPVLAVDATLKTALDKMTLFGIGIACFVDGNFQLKGVLTDGDLRRLILTRQNPLPALLISRALEFGTTSPVTAGELEPVAAIKEKFITKRVWDLPVTDESQRLLGLIHFHSL